MRFSGRYKPVALAGLALSTLSACTLAWGAGRVPVTASVAWMLLLGLGIGASQPPMTLASQNAVPAGEIGIATALQMFARAVGAAVGVAAASALVLQGLGPDNGWQAGAAAQAIGPAVIGRAARTFSVLAGGFATILGFAWLALIRLPVLPFRQHPANDKWTDSGSPL